MTTKNELLIKGYVRKMAQAYGDAQLINLTNPIVLAYEQNEGLSSVEIGKAISKTILDSHMLGLADHQIAELEKFWELVAEEAKS